MNTVDQRILIPTSPEVVWAYVSNIHHNPEWQADCQSVTFITTNQTGQGVRWRYTTRHGREQIAEITAWYANVGYEYTIVDGTPFKENRGRIRLQEVAEGTIVQWTFNYTLKGAFSGLRNSIGAKRSVEKNIVDSLWELWRRISEDNPEAPGELYSAKSLMREAPDVEARSNYKPRHPSPLHGEIPQVDVQQPTVMPESPRIEEPPVEEDDTRPRPVVEAAESVPADMDAPKSVQEPEFLSQIPDQQFEPIPEKETVAFTSPTKTEPDPAEQEYIFGRPSADKTVPQEQEPIVPERPITPASAEPEHITPELHRSETFSPQPTPAEPVHQEEDEVRQPYPNHQAPIPEPITDPTDTANISVFDLFGVARPGDESTTTKPPAIPEPEKPIRTEPEPKPVLSREPLKPAPQPESVVTPSGPQATPGQAAPQIKHVEISEGRKGLRLVQRRRLNKVRTPK